MLIRLKKHARIIGYVAFAVVALGFSFYLTFPTAAVGQRLAYEVQKRSGGKVLLTFEDVSLYRLTGLCAEGLKARLIKEDGEAAVIFLDEVCGRLRILPLLVFNLSGSTKISLKDGRIYGVFTEKNDGLDLDLEIDELDLTNLPIIKQALGLPISGSVTAAVKLALGLAAEPVRGAGRGVAVLAADRTEGDIEISLLNGAIGVGTLAGFTVPASIGLGQIEAKIQIKHGRLKLTSFEQKGGALSLMATGSANLHRNSSSSTMESCIKIKFTDSELLAKQPKLATVMQLAETQFQKDGNGYLNIRHMGPLSRPRSQRGLCRGGEREMRKDTAKVE